MWSSVLYCSILTLALVVADTAQSSELPESNKIPKPDMLSSEASSNCATKTGICNRSLALISDFKYIGGFRLAGDRFGNDKSFSLNNSRGIFTYNQRNHSVFVVGSPKSGAIAEFPIPPLVVSDDINKLNVASKPLQPFTKIHKTPRVNTGIKQNFRITGLELLDNKLLVNYVNWYDASGKEENTSIFIEDASNLASSAMWGPFRLDGKAHAAGWLSKIPQAWQDRLGGTHIAGGQSGSSIISRLSVGPSAFVFSPQSSIFNRKSGPVKTEKLLDFPIKNLLYDKTVYGPKVTNPNEILYNKNGKNDLWTVISGAGYGFIIPGTSTYLTIGKSGGIRSGLGYKIVQDNGKLCPGPCSIDHKDNYSYYWLWNVEDLLDVKFGLAKPYDVRPYDYGEFELPINVEVGSINGGAFDHANSILYLSVPRVDESKRFNKLPVFLAYKFQK